MPKAKTLSQVIAAEAGGKTRAQRLTDMKNIYSSMVNRSKATGVTIKDVFSITSQYNAYNNTMPPGTAKLTSLADEAISYVDANGVTHAGLYYATPAAVGNLPKGLVEIAVPGGVHKVFADPKNRAVITAAGTKKVDPSRLAQSTAPEPSAGLLASLFGPPADAIGSALGQQAGLTNNPYDSGMVSAPTVDARFGGALPSSMSPMQQVSAGVNAVNTIGNINSGTMAPSAIANDMTGPMSAVQRAMAGEALDPRGDYPSALGRDAMQTPTTNRFQGMPSDPATQAAWQRAVDAEFANAQPRGIPDPPSNFAQGIPSNVLKDAMQTSQLPGIPDAIAAIARQRPEYTYDPVGAIENAVMASAPPGTDARGVESFVSRSLAGEALDPPARHVAAALGGPPMRPDNLAFGGPNGKFSVPQRGVGDGMVSGPAPAPGPVGDGMVSGPPSTFSRGFSPSPSTYSSAGLSRNAYDTQRANAGLSQNAYDTQRSNAGLSQNAYDTQRATAGLSQNAYDTQRSTAGLSQNAYDVQRAPAQVAKNNAALTGAPTSIAGNTAPSSLENALGIRNELENIKDASMGPVSVPSVPVANPVAPPAVTAPPAAVLAPALVPRPPVQDMPVYQAPPSVPSLRPSDIYSGTIGTAVDSVGNVIGRSAGDPNMTSVTNQWGATTGMKNGYQTAVGSMAGIPSIPGISGPNASNAKSALGKVGTAVKGAIPGAAGSLIGGAALGPIGAVLGGLLGRAIAQQGIGIPGIGIGMPGGIGMPSFAGTGRGLFGSVGPSTGAGRGGSGSVSASNPSGSPNGGRNGVGAGWSTSDRLN